VKSKSLIKRRVQLPRKVRCCFTARLLLPPMIGIEAGIEI
jgi:hypothetical protein